MIEPSRVTGLAGRVQALMPKSRPWREALLFGAALAFGLLAIPFLIWAAGHRTLGLYTHGDNRLGFGPMTLFSDYFSGLAHGWAGYWAVALGPALLVGAARLWLAALRHLPRD